MRTWKTLLLAVAPVALLAMAGPASAGPYYKGKTVTLIVPNSPAGMMSRYAHLLAPHIAQKLGASEVRVKNIKGGGGLKGTNVLWKSKPDGLTIGFTNVPALIVAQLAESPGVRFDATKLTYLGRAAAEPRVLYTGAKNPIKNAKDLASLKKPFKYAAQGTDEDFYSVAVFAKAAGFPLTMITGYEGDADSALAVIKGDADGHLTSLTSATASFKSGDTRPLVFFTDKRVSEYPDVPTVLELIKDPSKEAPLAAIVSIVAMSRGFFGPANMNAEATKEMRAAIEATLTDPAVLKEAGAKHMPIVSWPGAEQQVQVKKIVAASHDLTPILKAALKSIK